MTTEEQIAILQAWRVEQDALLERFDAILHSALEDGEKIEALKGVSAQEANAYVRMLLRLYPEPDDPRFREALEGRVAIERGEQP